MSLFQPDYRQLDCLLLTSCVGQGVHVHLGARMPVYLRDRQCLTIPPTLYRLVFAGPCDQDNDLPGIIECGKTETDPIRRWLRCITHWMHRLVGVIALARKQTGRVPVLPHS